MSIEVSFNDSRLWFDKPEDMSLNKGEKTVISLKSQGASVSFFCNHEDTGGLVTFQVVSHRFLGIDREDVKIPSFNTHRFGTELFDIGQGSSAEIRINEEVVAEVTHNLG